MNAMSWAEFYGKRCLEVRNLEEELSLQTSEVTDQKEKMTELYKKVQTLRKKLHIERQRAEQNKLDREVVKDVTKALQAMRSLSVDTLDKNKSNG
jgi:hypothetical protein